VQAAEKDPLPKLKDENGKLNSGEGNNSRRLHSKCQLSSFRFQLSIARLASGSFEQPENGFYERAKSIFQITRD
jgi:hypothetical protein